MQIAYIGFGRHWRSMSVTMLKTEKKSTTESCLLHVGYIMGVRVIRSVTLTLTMAHTTSYTTSAHQTRENSRFLSYPGQDKNFYPWVKSLITLSGVQEIYISYVQQTTFCCTSLLTGAGIAPVSWYSFGFLHMVDYSISSLRTFYTYRDRRFVTIPANIKNLITNCVINRLMSIVLSFQSRKFIKLNKSKH